MIGEIGSFKMKKLLLILLCLPMIGFGQDKNDYLNTYIETLDGEFVKIKQIDNNGNPIILVFWYPYCVPCDELLNDMSLLYKKWQDKMGVKIIAVTHKNEAKRRYTEPQMFSLEWFNSINGTTFLIIADEQ